MSINERVRDCIQECINENNIESIPSEISFIRNYVINHFDNDTFIKYRKSDIMHIFHEEILNIIEEIKHRNNTGRPSPTDLRLKFRQELKEITSKPKPVKKCVHHNLLKVTNTSTPEQSTLKLSALKATIIDRNPRSINTVSLTTYLQSNRRNWKREKVCDLVDSLMKLDESKTPVTTTSKYEVLYETVRKIYLDIERIPFSDENVVFELLTDINKFFRKKCGDQMKDDMKFIITYNKSSANHSGKSYHAYCTNYCMNYKILRNTVAEFVNTDGMQYKDYVDCSVYSKNRLFKMPYYIGIVQEGTQSHLDTNTDNYHMIISKCKTSMAEDDCEISDDEDTSDDECEPDTRTQQINSNLVVECNSEYDFYNGIIIQSIQGTTQLNLPMVYGDKVYRTKNISFGGVTNTRRLLQSVRHLETLILDKKVGTTNDGSCVNVDKLMSIVIKLFDNKHRFKEIIQEKIETMHSYFESRTSYDKNVMLRYDVLINNIKQHNSALFEELQIDLYV